MGSNRGSDLHSNRELQAYRDFLTTRSEEVRDQIMQTRSELFNFDDIRNYDDQLVIHRWRQANQGSHRERPSYADYHSSNGSSGGLEMPMRRVGDGRQRTGIWPESDRPQSDRTVRQSDVIGNSRDYDLSGERYRDRASSEYRLGSLAQWVQSTDSRATNLAAGVHIPTGFTGVSGSDGRAMNAASGVYIPTGSATPRPVDVSGSDVRANVASGVYIPTRPGSRRPTPPTPGPGR